MGLTEIKKELKKLDKNKLIEIVADLYKKNTSVKEFFDFYINPEEKELFNKYREKVYAAFFPKHGFNYSLKDGKKAISDFKKLGASAEFLADLMLFYVETGVKFTIDYGDINETFYNSLATTFKASLTLMEKENVLPKFETRVDKIIDDTKQMGWGFHDYLLQTSYDFYPPEIDENFEENQIETEEKGKIIKLNRH